MHDYWRNQSFDDTDHCWQRVLSRFVIAFLPRGKCLLISWLRSPSTMILEPRKIKSVTASTFMPIYLPKSDEMCSMILVFWMLSFKQAFSLSSFTLVKRILSFSLLSAIRVVICISEVDISPRNLDSSLGLIQPRISHNVLCIEVK